MKKKVLLVLVAAVLLIGATIGTTLAYLTDKTDSITNTFTIGNISIDLEETWNKDTDADTVNDAWEAKLVPGKTYSKDPTVTVNKDSEASFVFVKVTAANNKFGTSPNQKDIVTYSINTTNWTLVSGQTDVYYKKVAATTADVELGVLKDNEVTINSALTQEDIKAITTTPTITVVAYAIQQEGFSGANDGAKAAAAWTALKTELSLS